VPIQWFDVQKQLGPLTVGRMGLLTQDDSCGLALDAALDLSALHIGLRGFTLAFQRSDFSIHSLSVGLDGLDISYSAGTLELSGGLVKSSESGVTEYNGHLVLTAGAYGMSAIGSFAEVGGAPSLFVFGMVQGAFGGPPAFFVTGIAAGFGYNRALRLPTQDQVRDFPLVAMATSGAEYLPPNATPQDALGKLDQGGWVPPTSGAYWLAVGVQFTSFELVYAFAVLTVQFGHELVFALLGLAAIQLPTEGEAFAYAELMLDAVLKPSEGTLQITAVLSPNSFVLAPDCRLTGGFAFYAWFGDSPHAGDFVITLGGYHPMFSPPAHYPSVPRLGFSWNIGSDVTIRGDAYFALTPSCVMGGGSLDLNFQSGDLHAWFNAHADFIMWWKPFYFIVDIGVSLGASYKVDLWFTSVTLSVELSCDVELWGPPLAGKAHVHWTVISFTVNINGGGDPSPPGTSLADWDHFHQTYMPAPPAPTPAPMARLRPRVMAAAAALPVTNTNAIRLQAATGLVRTIEHPGHAPIWVVSAGQFTLALETLVPASQLAVTNGPAPFEGPEPVGLYPLGSLTLSSPLTLTIGDADAELLANWDWAPTHVGVPESMWGTVNLGHPNLAATTITGLMGMVAHARSPVPSGPPLAELSVLGIDDLDPPLPLPLVATVHDGHYTPPGAPRDGRLIVHDTLTGTTTRSALVKALEAGPLASGRVDGDLIAFVDDVALSFAAAPLIGPLGSTGPVAPSAAPQAPTSLSSRAVPECPAAEPRLQAIFHRTALPGAGTGWDRAFSSVATVHGLQGRAGGDERLHALAHSEGGGSPETPADLGAPLAALLPGTTALWAVPSGRTPRLEAVGPHPVQALVLDAGSRLLTHTRLDADGALDLPAGAASVALSQAHPAGEAPVIGWHGRSPLLALAPQAFMGQQALVRPQAPMPMRKGRRSRGPSVMDGRALIGSNWTEALDGRRRGWVETRLLQPVKLFVVLLRRDGGLPADGAIAPPLVQLAAPGEPAIVLALSGVSSEGDTAALVYAVPSAWQPATDLQVWVEAPAGWHQDGLLGFTRSPADPAPPMAAAPAAVPAPEPARAAYTRFR
jgi:hypothetical protein